MDTIVRSGGGRLTSRIASFRRVLATFALVAPLLYAADSAGQDAPTSPADGHAAQGQTASALANGDDTDAPVSAGPMTREAAEAERLREAGRWAEASVALYRVANGETGDDVGTRQVAQYHLATALYRLGFYESSLGEFASIADVPNHVRFAETLPWLSRLAAVLPDRPAIIERVGRFPDSFIASYKGNPTQGTYWKLSYLRGLYEYRGHNLERAISFFEQVGPASDGFAEAQLMVGIANLSLQKTGVAARAFRRVVETSHDAGTRELAWLWLARSYYTRAVGRFPFGAGCCMPTFDYAGLASAVKHWDLIPVSSSYWLDATFESAWAYFVATDYAHARRNLRTLESAYFSNAFYPKAYVLETLVGIADSQDERAAAEVAARGKKRHEPIWSGLVDLIDQLDREGGAPRYYDLLTTLHASRGRLPPPLVSEVRGALSDREIQRHLDHVRALEDESALLERMPAEFRNSAVGHEIREALARGRAFAVHDAGELIRARIQWRADEVRKNLIVVTKILNDRDGGFRSSLLRESALGWQ